MTIGSIRRLGEGSLATLLLATALALMPVGLAGQTAPELSFLRALGDHHDLPADEVAILAEWEIPIGEIPVVLMISGRAGISPDALVAARRNGRDWATLAGRYGLDMRFFHVDFESVPEPVSALYEQLASTPRDGWSGVTPGDLQVIFLVNVRFLHEYGGVSASRAAEAMMTHGSPAEALRAISP